MTIEELLGMPTPSLEAMTDPELERHLRPYFPATRPASRLENAVAIALDQRKVINPDSPAAKFEQQFLERYEQEQQAKAASAKRIPLSQLASKVPPAKR